MMIGTRSFEFVWLWLTLDFVRLGKPNLKKRRFPHALPVAVSRPNRINYRFSLGYGDWSSTVVHRIRDRI